MLLPIVELAMFIIFIILPIFGRGETNTSYHCIENHRFSAFVETPDALKPTSVWKQYINIGGKIIIRGNKPASSIARRYFYPHNEADKSYLDIKRTQYTHGTYYAYSADGGATRNLGFFLKVSGAYSSNLTSVTLTEGDTVIFHCGFVYRGPIYQELLWEGPPSVNASRNIRHLQLPNKLAVDVYAGMANFTITIKATPSMNGTRLRAAQYGYAPLPKKRIFAVTSPPLKVMCKGNRVPRDCHDFSCKTDKPCKHKGICVDVSKGVTSCNCTAYYTGEFCKAPVPCPVIQCQNIRRPCRNTSRGHFKCYCKKGYRGIFCETKRTTTLKPTTKAIKHMEQKGISVLYLLLLLLLIPLIMTIGIFTFLKRRRDQRQAEEEAERLLKQQQEEEVGFIDMILSYMF